MGYNLTRSQFNRWERADQPSRYETFGVRDACFTTPMNHAVKCRGRLHVALRSGLQRLWNGPQTRVDFGPFPGSLLGLLRGIKPTRAAPLFSAGLMASPEFVHFMRGDVDVDILIVNLDPSGQQLASKGYQEKVSLSENSAQIVIALEILEPFTSGNQLVSP